MTWLVSGIIGFLILCGLTAVAYAFPRRGEELDGCSGAIEGDQRHFNQRGSSPSGG